MSWELLKKLGWLDTDVSVESLYSNWLIGYSSLLGPDRRHHDRRLFPGTTAALRPVLALYQDDAAYPAWNTRGLCRVPRPGGLTLVAITTGRLGWFYDYGWFTGSLLGGMIYYLLGRQRARSLP